MSDKVSYTITKGLVGYHEDFLFTGVDDPLLVATVSMDFDHDNHITDVRLLKKEKSAPKTTPDFTKASSNKYERGITDRQGNSATVDVYDVLKAFEVTCPATQHAVKKLLCSGLRGHKDLQTDLIEAKESIVRAIELNKELK